MAALHKRPRRRLHLLASTSAIALILTALPVTFDIEPGGQKLTLQSSSAWAESCCFLAGTLVRMADGRERPIENVSVGDCVCAPGGGQNRVTGVERPRLGRRRLYGFNGGPAFFTAEHPFMTLSGWKAVDPEATALETRNLHVAPLVPGDVLLVEPVLEVVGAKAVGAEAGVAELAPYRLVSIESTAADPETPLYNLLLDGDHRYFANGFLVHNKGEGGDTGGGEGGSGGGEGPQRIPPPPRSRPGRLQRRPRKTDRNCRPGANRFRAVFPNKASRRRSVFATVLRRERKLRCDRGTEFAALFLSVSIWPFAIYLADGPASGRNLESVVSRFSSPAATVPGLHSGYSCGFGG